MHHPRFGADVPQADHVVVGPQDTQQNFGRPRSDRFLTGAAYSEHDGDDFDYVGEGGIRFCADEHCTAFEGVGPKLQF